MKKMVSRSIVLIGLFILMSIEGFSQVSPKRMIIKSGEKVVYSSIITDSLAIQFEVIENGCIDEDGNSYSTIIIGNQEWTVENLRTTKYNDGTSIPKITDSTTWLSTVYGAYCAYGNNENNVATYGYLYNWHAINTGKLAPVSGGWRVPTDEDWTTLIDNLGGRFEAGGKLKETTTAHWESPNYGATNSSGFTALPGGLRSFTEDGSFKELGRLAYWWSSSTDYFPSATSRYILNTDAEIYRNDLDQRYGLSVRLVRDVD